MAKSLKENKFQEKAAFILNDVAEVVLDWNLGNLTNDEAIKKINRAFAKQDLLTWDLPKKLFVWKKIQTISYVLVYHNTIERDYTVTCFLGSCVSFVTRSFFPL